MCLVEELLESVEGFFEQIPDVDDLDLDIAMDSLRHLLECKLYSGTTSLSDELAGTVREHLDEIWNLLSDEVRQDCDLSESYSELIQLVSEDGFDSDLESSNEQKLESEEEKSWD